MSMNWERLLRGGTPGGPLQHQYAKNRMDVQSWADLSLSVSWGGHARRKGHKDFPQARVGSKVVDRNLFKSPGKTRSGTRRLRHYPPALPPNASPPCRSS